jgi:hypothetical protein
MHAIASILVAAFFCPPFAYYWDLSGQRANLCGDDTKLQLSTAVVKMILDFLIVLLPLPILRQLQMSWEKKTLLSGIFSLGLWSVLVLFLCLSPSQAISASLHPLLHSQWPNRTHAPYS